MRLTKTARTITPSPASTYNLPQQRNFCGAGPTLARNTTRKRQKSPVPKALPWAIESQPFRLVDRGRLARLNLAGLDAIEKVEGRGFEEGKSVETRQDDSPLWLRASIFCSPDDVDLARRHNGTKGKNVGLWIWGGAKARMGKPSMAHGDEGRMGIRVQAGANRHPARLTGRSTRARA
jgi:hypothetical protein